MGGISYEGDEKGNVLEESVSERRGGIEIIYNMFNVIRMWLLQERWKENL